MSKSSKTGRPSHRPPVAHLRRLSEAGYSNGILAQAFGVSRGTIIRWKKYDGVGGSDGWATWLPPAKLLSDLISDGHTVRELAEIYGRSTATVRAWTSGLVKANGRVIPLADIARNAVAKAESAASERSAAVKAAKLFSTGDEAGVLAMIDEGRISAKLARAIKMEIVSRTSGYVTTALLSTGWTVRTLALTAFSDQAPDGLDAVIRRAQELDPATWEAVVALHDADGRDHIHIALRRTDSATFKAWGIIKDLGLYYRVWPEDLDHGSQVPFPDLTLVLHDAVTTCRDYAAYVTYMTHTDRKSLEAGKHVYQTDGKERRVWSNHGDAWLRNIVARPKDNTTSRVNRAYALGLARGDLDAWLNKLDGLSSRDERNLTRHYERGLRQWLDDNMTLPRTAIYVNGADDMLKPVVDALKALGYGSAAVVFGEKICGVRPWTRAIVTVSRGYPTRMVTDLALGIPCPCGGHGPFALWTGDLLLFIGPAAGPFDYSDDDFIDAVYRFYFVGRGEDKWTLREPGRKGTHSGLYGNLVDMHHAAKSPDEALARLFFRELMSILGQQ